MAPWTVSGNAAQRTNRAGWCGVVNRDAASEILVTRYFAKADQALRTGRLNCEAGDANAAINRLYYACFYALTAQMLADGKQFVRHSAIRNALNEHLIHAGILARTWPVLQPVVYRSQRCRLRADGGV